MRHPVVFLAALLGLAACDAPVESSREAVPAAEAPSSPAESRDPLVAAGPAATVQPDADTNIQWAASVVRLDQLNQQGGATVKLFGTAGGDPAMNGLYAHIAFFKSSAEGWAVFRIGDVLDYEILSEAPGRVDLKLEESTMDEATGQIGSRERRVIVSWTPGADDAPPASVSVTPAR